MEALDKEGIKDLLLDMHLAKGNHNIPEQQDLNNEPTPGYRGSGKFLFLFEWLVRKMLAFLLTLEQRTITLYSNQKVIKEHAIEINQRSLGNEANLVIAKDAIELLEADLLLAKEAFILLEERVTVLEPEVP